MYFLRLVTGDWMLLHEHGVCLNALESTGLPFIGTMNFCIAKG